MSVPAILSSVLMLLQSVPPANFVNGVAPILEASCVGCHGASSGKRSINLASRQAMLDSKVLNPGNPLTSALFTTVRNGSMPPGGKLSSVKIEIIRQWILNGAEWPAGATLKPAVAAESTPQLSGELAVVRQIRDRILAHSHEGGSFQAYQVAIPNTTVRYDMALIPAGTFMMGSLPGAPKDEQPQHKVHLDAFWMQAHEVTWDEYRLFMFANQAGEVAHKDDLVDGVSRPTRPYVEMSFGMGINGFPAISMTQHAANKYAEWLSSKTGEFYRLPTEAEWEYACKAGSTAPSELGRYAWFGANSGGKYAPVATKMPNGWKLYDILGNVMEWTLDGYSPYRAGEQTNPWVTGTQPYPHAVRGGSWNDPAEKLTCTARVPSDSSWKEQDPQLPKSIWYHTDAQWLGFRLVRPAKVPSAEQMYKYWNNGVEHDEH